MTGADGDDDPSHVFALSSEMKITGMKRDSENRWVEKLKSDGHRVMMPADLVISVPSTPPVLLVLEVKKTNPKSSKSTMAKAEEQCRMYLAGLEKAKEENRQVDGLSLTADTRVIGFVVLAKQNKQGKMNFEVKRVEPGGKPAIA